MKTLITALAVAAASGAALAENGPAGLWKTSEDGGRAAATLVRLSDSGGTLSGRIEKLLDPARQDARCEACSDDRKGQPLLGLSIVRNARPDAAEAGTWSGGEILDPATGKVYRARLRPLDGGRKLELRVYAGPAWRTQTWTRVE